MDDLLGREGFSLIEMLVAMAVFALAAMALLNLSGESIRSAARAQDRTLGGIVADNVAAETVLGLGDGAEEGRVSLAGRDWRWRRSVAATEVPDLRRVEVQVLAEENEEAARRIVFAGVQGR